ncbi:MAG: serine/threonine-protein kinase, partial [Longimicrobiales bacterium]|nr:serine/threonine-protein kinase [Longimicrobiales bacterium]
MSTDRSPPNEGSSRQDRSRPGHTRPGSTSAAFRRERIGPYRLLDVLGEGGMGTVYLGEQTDPIRRRVALKVIKLGMDTREIVARFESERQALAVMEHPNIARVFEAGATEDGRPYFVMELVEGSPISTYCDGSRLTTRERVELFIAVCDAVQHAHQKGVIHRDLKPSNVIVTAKDGTPVPKVIDFGIAKAMGRDLTDRTKVTRAGQLLGTPQYMSPEQAEGSGLDVDTRTDVYSLGAILYELLAGAPPLDLERVPDAALGHAVREKDPPTPSTRLTTLGEAAERVARHRRTGLHALKKELAGDLDWIVMKAIEKDRGRRYGTPLALAEDLGRFLRREPVAARPPSRLYRARRFVQRNRAAVLAAVLVIVSLVAGATLATAGMLRARRAEERAEAQARTAEAAVDFLVELFRDASPYESTSGPLSAEDLLDRGRERLTTEVGEEPLLRRRLAAGMGEAYAYLGRLDEAESLFEEEVGLAREHFRDDPVTLARSLQHLANISYLRREFDRAEQLIQEALSRLREAPAGEETHSARALAFATLGSIQSDSGEPVEG